MALQKQSLGMPFASGLDTKTDDKQLELGKFTVLENVVFPSLNQVKKRNGYVSVPTRDLSNSKIESAKQLTTFKDELILFNDLDLYSRSETLGKWINKGRVFSCVPENTQVIRNTYSQESVDVLTIEDLNVFVYSDQSGARVSILDSSNRISILSNALISATGSLTKVTRIQNKIFLFYVDGTAIKYKTVNVLQPTTLSSESTVISDLHATDKFYDVAMNAAAIAVCYNNSSAQLSFIRINSDETLTGITSLASESPVGGLSLSIDSSFRLIATYGTATAVKIAIRSFNIGTSILAPTVIETVSDVCNVTSVEESTGLYRVYYEISSANDFDHSVRHNTVTYTGTVGSAQLLARSIGLASKPWRFNNLSYVTTIHSNELQSTYFVFDSEGKIVGKINNQNAGSLIAAPSLPKIAQLATDRFLVPTQLKNRIIESEDTFFLTTGITASVLDFDIEKLYQNDILGNNLHIVGGFVRMYDGKEVVEHGFHVYPEGLSAGATATTGGSISDGNYSYVAVYAWADNQGNLHRSAPSPALDVVLTGATNTQTQEIVVPTLRLTDKENVIIEIYRTEDAGTIYYKITDTLNPQFNDKTVDSITFTDDLSDTSLINNELLYTTGNVLEAISAPSCQLIEQHNSRIFLAGLEDENQLVYSKVRGEAEPVEFNDTLVLNVDSYGGGITAIKSLDEKLIIFKRDAMYYLAGDGPNNLGQQDNFTTIELISSDVGCVDKDSLVLTPIGLMFKSRKGIYILTRSLDVQYVGAAVERFNSSSITSAVLMPTKNQVRFTTVDSDCLVFDYFVGQWATFTNHQALSAAYLNEDYFYLRPDNVIYKEDSTSYSDNGTPIKMRIETGWLSFAGVQGYQRVYSVHLLGEFKSEHSLRMRAAYDFNPAYIHEKIIDTSDFAQTSAYGEDSPYGNDAYGGQSNVYQLRLDMKKQKCQSMKLSIEDIQSTPGEALSLSNLLFKVGVKAGPFSIDSGRKYGTLGS